MKAALETLRALKASGCVVLGEPAYYSRFGFRLEPRLVFPAAPAEYFQAISFGGPMPSGVVSYHKAFEARE
jgi:predicted N-acetyltransferase YhbS